jgi:hypothetical protein
LWVTSNNLMEELTHKITLFFNFVIAQCLAQ